MLDVGQAGCAWAAPHSTVTGNTGRCWSGWAPRAGTHETSMGTREQISLQTDSSLSSLPPLLSPGIAWCSVWSSGQGSSAVSCGHRHQASCHHHAPSTRITVLQILFIKSPWACHNRTVEKWYHHEVDENTGLGSLTDITEPNTHFPCPGPRVQPNWGIFSQFFPDSYIFPHHAAFCETGSHVIGD